MKKINKFAKEIGKLMDKNNLVTYNQKFISTTKNSPFYRKKVSVMAVKSELTSNKTIVVSVETAPYAAITLTGDSNRILVLSYGVASANIQEKDEESFLEFLEFIN